MSFPEAPRCGLAYRRACELIVSEPIHILPADPFTVIRRHGWGLVSYRELSRRLGVALDELLAAVPSPDGFTVCTGGNYCVAYNSDVEMFGRIVFTLFHEVGHIQLGHFGECGRAGLPNGTRRLFEREANFFASNVMAPFVVMDLCGYDTVESLCVACGLSRGAAEIRLSEYRDWVGSPWDDRVRSAMLEYIRVNRRRKMAPRVEQQGAFQVRF